MGFFKSRHWLRLTGLGIVGIVLLVMGLSDLIGAQTFRSDMLKNIENGENIIDYMQPSDYKLKANVCGNIYDLLGCYCTETTTNTVNGMETSSHTSGSYYLMPIYPETGDDVYYITVVARTGKFTAQCDMLLDDLDEYFGGNENVEFHDCILYGKVKELEDDAREYLIEAIKEIELLNDFSEATINKYVLPYQLEEYNYENHMNAAKVMIPFGLVFIAIFVVFFIVINKRNSDVNESNINNSNAPASIPDAFDADKPVENMFKQTQTSKAEIDEPQIESKPTVQPGQQTEQKPVEQAGQSPVQQSSVQDVAATQTEQTPVPHSERRPVSTAQESVQMKSSSVDNDGMLSADVSQEELDKLPEDGTVRTVFNYDNDGMGGIDVSELDLSSLDDYNDLPAKEDDEDNNIYENEEEEYTFDSDPSSIQIAEMDS